MPPAVVLLSGGLDSYTAAAIAKRDGFELFALTVRYGQRHAEEIAASRRVASHLGVSQHLELDVDLSRMGGSALTADIDVPKDQPIDTGTIPVTYVPARNTVFLSLALGWAEVIGAHDLVIGVNALDYSGYPDCRPPRPGSRAGGFASTRRCSICRKPTSYGWAGRLVSITG
jgi:7-cyano-7-deazaguanine synthase